MFMNGAPNYFESADSTLSSLRILHILTLSGARGEYGGPNKVASELCAALQKRGHVPHIFTGVQGNSIPGVNQNQAESFEIVHPLNRRFPVSSLWARKLPKTLFSLVKSNDVVHIHFARDLIPVLAAYICIFLRKPYFTQTHGMVIEDNRMSTRVFDFLFTRFALNHSRMNFLLSTQEQAEISPLGLKCPISILPNGIAVPDKVDLKSNHSTPNIIFCSRLHARKRPEWFLSLAKYASLNNLDANFLIFGPDGGELQSIVKEINSNPALTRVKYKGSLAPSEVQDVLLQSSLLVLPSKNEPFPMVVLEALSVGTPVLIMPSCGIATIIKNELPELVTESEDEQSLFLAFAHFFNKGFSEKDRSIYRKFCRQFFDIEQIAGALESFYRKAL